MQLQLVDKYHRLYPKEAIKTEGGQIATRMVGAEANAAPDDSGVQAAIGDYLAYLNKYFYTCDTEFLRRLADMWVEDVSSPHI